MATGTILFDMAGAIPADGTGSGNNPPFASMSVSSAAQTTNSPKVTYLTWAFDATTDEHLLWNFRMPQDYSSGGTLYLEVAPVANQGADSEVVFKAALAAVTPGNSELIATKSFGTVATGSVSMSQANSGTLYQVSISPGLDGVVAGDQVTLFIGRDADHTMDDTTGDVLLCSAALEYTTT